MEIITNFLRYDQVLLSMKKISISIDEKTLLKIIEHIDKGKFRNKSHAIEFAVNYLLEGK